IAEIELQLNRPVACRAAWELAIAHQPGNSELRETLKKAFGDESALPVAGGKQYVLKESPARSPPAKKKIWHAALQQQKVGRLADIEREFEKLAGENAENAAAWYNLALARAWLGNNVAAVQALDEYVRREADESQASDAWALAEVLRCGTGVP